MWKSDIVAPEDIHNRDTIVIGHRVDGNNLRITNGGTLIVTGDLSATNITLNGPDSKIVVEPGAVLNAAKIQGDNGQNIIYKGNSPLPVTLVAFKLQAASAFRQSNTLLWQTASEFNNHYFSVEKSTDGKFFTEAGRVQGTNHATGASYAFEDKQIASHTYYRLKQVDFDGKETYSAIIVATAQPKPELHSRNVVFGNDFSGQLRLLTVNGQEVRSQQLQHTRTFELPKELNGMYILILESGNAATSQRILL